MMWKSLESSSVRMRYRRSRRSRHAHGDPEGATQRQAVHDLESKNAKLKEEVKRLKEELEDERKANSIAATKLGESMELVRKMEQVVQQPAHILNKAKLFDGRVV